MRRWPMRLALVSLALFVGCTTDPGSPGSKHAGAQSAEQVAASPSPSAAPSASVVPGHLVMIRDLVRDVEPGATNYQHKPTVVVWEPGTAGEPACHADCSGLMNELFKRSYGLSDADLKAWLKSDRPLARSYHNAIVAQRGFERIEDFSRVRPGDVIATRYEPGAGNSGHVMMVDEPPVREVRGASEPGGGVLPAGAGVWRVHVIDASRTGHGPGDTRFDGARRVRNGLGMGYFRVATDTGGAVVAHAFGTAPGDAWHSVQERPLAVGRVTSPVRAAPRAGGIRDGSMLTSGALHYSGSGAARRRPRRRAHGRQPRRLGTRFHPGIHAGHHPLPSVPGHLVGSPVQPSQGLHARVHD